MTKLPTPPFLYGTAWKEETTRPLTKLAIQNGFRGIDTANQRKHYYEAAVGEAVSEALDEGLVERSELFIQTKFTYTAGQDHRLPYDPKAPFAAQVEQSFTSSLKHLGLDFIDSYILHGPSTSMGLTDADHEVWAAMEELLIAGKTGAIGTSNVSAEQLEKLIAFSGEPLSFVQNRCFARTGWDYKVRRICAANGITYQGFSLLTANRRELNSEALQKIAAAHDVTIPQVVFRFALHLGMLPLTGTTSERHMKEDLACLDFELSDREVQTIEEIALGG